MQFPPYILPFFVAAIVAVTTEIVVGGNVTAQPKTGKESRKSQIIGQSFLHKISSSIKRGGRAEDARKQCKQVNEKEVICETRGEKLDFIMLGDFGGTDIMSNGKSIGRKPTKGQKLAAKAMKDLIAKKAIRKPMFILNPGDNFYNDGIFRNEADVCFKNVFVDVYSSLDTPFFSIAGNHDYKVPDEMIDQFKTGIPDVAARNERMFEASREMLRAQLEYKGSNLWKFPSEYYMLRYKVRRPLKHMLRHPNVRSTTFTVAFLMLDTQLLCGIREDDFERFPAPEKVRISEEHFAWFEQQLEANKNADYLFVVGHHPFYYTEEQRQFPCTQRMRTLLIKYKISAYICGHEHNVSYVENGFVNIVAGGGSRLGSWRPTSVPDAKFTLRYPMEWTNKEGTAVLHSGAFITTEITTTYAKFQFWAVGEKFYTMIKDGKKALAPSASKNGNHIAHLHTLKLKPRMHGVGSKSGNAQQ